MVRGWPAFSGHAQLPRSLTLHCANLPDGEVQSLLKIYERLRAPDLSSEFLPGNHFSCPAYQKHKNFCRLGLELQGSSVEA